MPTLAMKNPADAEDATFAADGESRGAGLIEWLDKAFSSRYLPLIEKAVSFAASRLKNESGLHRRTVFIWLKVRSFLVASREDVFAQCFKSLEGPFDYDCDDPEYVAGNEYATGNSVDNLLFATVQPKALLSRSATICRRYASFALKEATNTQRYLEYRVNAIKKFMDTPTTQHSDELLALQSDLEGAVRVLPLLQLAD
jgi:hypothetical protein